jgi:hypothetical protein
VGMIPREQTSGPKPLKCGGQMSDRSAGDSLALSPRERSRLAGILSRLSSSFDSERAAAGLLATAFVTRHNLTWSDLTEMLRPLPDLRVTSVDPQPNHDRRRAGRPWRGYCRRRMVGRGADLDLST